MLELVQRESVTAMLLTASHLQLLMEYPEFCQCTAKVHTLITGGECVPITLYPWA
jgi:hypothetical protein